MTMTNNATPALAILAGGGQLPGLLAAAAQAQGWGVHLVTFAGQPQPASNFPVVSSREFPLGQIGHILAHLKKNKVTHVALAGHLHKPGVLSLKPDAMGLKLLARAVIKHDDALLRAVTDFLEEEGFIITGVKELAPQLVAPAGLLSRAKPDDEEKEDIVLARNTLAVLGDLDIGQAVVVNKGAILGVEAAEGTDALIERCAVLRGDGDAGGILVKRAKPLQTELADLPFVGPVTLQLLARYGYRGLAVQTGKTLLLNQPELTEIANAHKIFILCE